MFLKACQKKWKIRILNEIEWDKNQLNIELILHFVVYNDIKKSNKNILG